jgi:glutamate-1-semialdehyde 2,1-aminomutase
MNSSELFSRAQKIIPGGVNSPVRAFKSVGSTPIYIEKASGSRIWSVEGKEYIDYCSSWGPCILGHAHPEVISAVTSSSRNGLTFGACTPGEVDIAEIICSCIPSIEMLRLVTSGTEAVMTALRLSRAFTGRNKIIKFDGCYHGHTDAMLVAAGSGLLTGGISSSKGVSQAVASDVFIAPYNDLASVNSILAQHGDCVSTIIVEPIAGNMGLVAPKEGFLEGLRSAADKYNCLLIFDEVITGFRLGPTSYGTLCGVVPDLTTLGKIIGGGMPIGAVGGRAEIMNMLSPSGSVYQAGTLSGNPVAISAGLTTIKLLRDTNPYPKLQHLCTLLASKINSHCTNKKYPVFCVNKGSLFTIYFRPSPAPQSLSEVKKSDTETFTRFFQKMLKRGIYLPPSQYETAFISAAHTEQDIDITTTHICEVLNEIYEGSDE